MKLKKLIIDTNDTISLNNKYFYFDNDFLSIMYSDEKIFEDVITCLEGMYIIDPLTSFEFLRGAFMPSDYEKKIMFLKNDKLFYPASEHIEIHNEIKENALLLSRIYKHKHHPSSPSFIDLMLSGRLMFSPANAVLITGNKKDFPSFIFDIVAILNYETNDGSIRSISILSFNKKSFEQCNDELKKLKN